MIFQSRYLSVAIERTPDAVYAYVSDPSHLPEWAAGLSGSIANENGVWVAESPMGRITIAFVSQNPYGVLDHSVTLPSGEVVLNPMRVVPNGDGSEVCFTLFRRPGMSDAEFETDADMVARDLLKLKTILEVAE